MRVASPLALIFIFCFPWFSALAQEAVTVRLGVTVLGSASNAVSGTEARDRLVKLLNGKKLDKTQPSVEAVPLDAATRAQAIAEARDKHCELVLYIHILDLSTTYRYSPSNGGEQLPVFVAALEYQLSRAVDGSGFAIGAVHGDDPASIQEAVRQALSPLAKTALAAIKKEKDTPNGPTTAAHSLTADAREYCTWLPSDIAHSDTLREACEYAITLTRKMPNFICGQSTARYAGDSRAPHDLITASVRYEDGHEDYSDVRVNGRKFTGKSDETLGLRSTGEFVGDLQAVFNLSNHALFQYSSENKLGDHAAWVFTYRIVEQKDPLWVLQARDQIIAPAYSGELWIDQKDGAVLRFRSVAKDMPPAFPMKDVALQIDYQEVVFADGTTFVLPVDSTLTNTIAGEETSRNVVQFRDCHKFRATARIVLKGAPETPASATESTPSLAAVQKDLDDSNAIFSALGERALQENEIRMQAEQKQMLDAVTASTLERLAALGSEQRKIQEQQQAIAKSRTAFAGGDALTTLKVRVNLVLVSVVLRDAKGNAVGSLSKENFRLLDEGKPQVITHFSVEAAGSRLPAGEKAANPLPGAAQTVTSQSPAAPNRVTGYLFDDVHLNLADLAAARDAAQRHIGSLNAGELAAVFATSGAVVVDFTGDRERLLTGLRQLKPHPLIPEANCPPISYYMADLMLNQHDPEAESTAVNETLDCALHGFNSGADIMLAKRLATAKAYEVLNAGDSESRNALAVLRNVIRRTESMPGQRSLVLVSPGFLAVTLDMRQETMEIVDHAVEAGIVVNTLDARGLYTTGYSGDSNVGPGRLALDSGEAQARSDVMIEFASGTGGIFFHNSNDLDEGFRRTADAPEFVYVLGFSPLKLDGKFHKLKVTLNAGKFQIQARQGYYAVKLNQQNNK
jgi:VWFA-related protein